MKKQQSLLGLSYALGAYVLWGFAPIYFKSIDVVSAGEILSHRILWSVPLLVLLIIFFTKFTKLGFITHFIAGWKRNTYTAILIAINWLVFTYAVTSERILETSLGYFINPLVSVILGMVFLREKLRSLQWVAVFAAVMGVVLSVFHYGTLPWISLTLAISFGFYGLLKKQSKDNPLVSLLAETLIASPLALCFLFYLVNKDQNYFGFEDMELNILLIAGGIVTVLPLWLFSKAAPLLNLATLGFIQYLAPSITFLLAVFLYNEALSYIQLATFVLIWIGLIIYSLESVAYNRKVQS